MQGILKKTTLFFLVIGTISLIYWPKVYFNGFINPFRFELIFSVAALCFFVDSVFNYFKSDFKINQVELKIYLLLFGLFVSILAPTIFFYYQSNLEFSTEGKNTLLKIIIGMGAFVSLYHLIRNNYLFGKIISWLLVIPSLFLVPFVFFPHLAEKFGLISTGYRFMGFTTNPSGMDFLVIVSYCYACSFLIYEIVETRNYKKIFLYSTLTLGLSCVILWSQTKSYILFLFLAPLAMTFFYGIYKKFKILPFLGYSILVISLTTLLVACSFLLIPLTAKKFLVLGRLGGHLDPYVLNVKLEDKSLFGELQGLYQAFHHPSGNESLPQAKGMITSDPRVLTWNYYLPLLAQHPFGLGINYYPKFGFHWTYPTTGEKTVLPAFFIFNVWAWGGIFAVGLICYLLMLTLFQFKRALLSTQQKELLPYRVGALLGFLSFWAMCPFNGLALEYVGFWVVFALALF